MIFKILKRSEWLDWMTAGEYAGSADDHRDGFIHLSRAEQVSGSLVRHFAGQHDLLLVGVDQQSLNGSLRFEPSRSGSLYPHVYGSIPIHAVRSVEPITAPWSA